MFGLKKRHSAGEIESDEPATDQEIVRKKVRNWGENALFVGGYFMLFLIGVSMVLLHPIAEQQRAAGTGAYAILYITQAFLFIAAASMLIFGLDKRVQLPRDFAVLFFILSILRVTALLVLAIELIILFNPSGVLPPALEVWHLYVAIMRDAATLSFFNYAETFVVNSPYPWGAYEFFSHPAVLIVIHAYKIGIFYFIVWSLHRWFEFHSRKELLKLKSQARAAA